MINKEKWIEDAENKIMRAVSETEYKQNFYPENGDYIGSDGIVICGSCGMPRGYFSKLFEPFGHDYIVLVPDMCECQKEKKAMKARQEKENTEKTAQEERRNAGLQSDAYRQMRLGNTDFTRGNTKQLDQALKYIRMINEGRTNKGLILSGGCGTGKTHVAACIANELIDCNKVVYMDTIGGMIKSMTDFKTEKGFSDMLAAADLVVVDDFGTERSTANANEKVFQIIDARARSKKPMIITTNLTKEELTNPQNKEQQRIYSRLLGVCGVITFLGGDIRIMCEMEQTNIELQELFN